MTGRLLEDPRAVWAVAAVSFLLFLIGNLPWQLDDYDQAKQAYTSFEMIKEGRWFYQQTPHERVATKPPLVGWVSAGLFAMTRLWELSWRLPSLLAAVALAVLLFRTADQGSDCLRVLTSRHCVVPMAPWWGATAGRAAQRLVWLVAMDRFTSCFLVMGHRRHFVSVRLL